MSTQTPRSQLIERRGELLAELFLQDLDPAFVSRPTAPDLGYDLLVGFPNEKAGINTLAIHVKSMERPPGPRVPIPRSTFDRVAHSNLPGLLLVADVKQNRLYYAWLKEEDTVNGAHTVSLPVIELNEKTQKILERQLKKADLVAIN